MESAGIGARNIELAKRGASSVRAWRERPARRDGPYQVGRFRRKGRPWPNSAVGFFRVDLGLGWGGNSFPSAPPLMKKSKQFIIGLAGLILLLLVHGVFTMIRAGTLEKKSAGSILPRARRKKSHSGEHHVACR